MIPQRSGCAGAWAELPDLSRADFTWCITVIDSGWDAARLLT